MNGTNGEGTARPLLILGNKTYSSWSLRAWIGLRAAGIPFDEVVIPLDHPDTRTRILAHSPSGRVPALEHGPVRLWESLAILEWAHETRPDAGMWPADPVARAMARAVSAEMHAGFPDLRGAMPMNVRKHLPGIGHTEAALRDAARVMEIWRECRSQFGGDGPFLFGRFGNADAMYAPVASRFTTYGVPLDPVSEAYATAVMDHPEMRAWVAAAHAEPWIIAHEELG